MIVSKWFKAQQRADGIRSCDYDKSKEDGGAKKTKCMSSNDRLHASINHTVTF